MDTSRKEPMLSFEALKDQKEGGGSWMSICYWYKRMKKRNVIMEEGFQSDYLSFACSSVTG